MTAKDSAKKKTSAFTPARRATACWGTVVTLLGVLARASASDQEKQHAVTALARRLTFFKDTVVRKVSFSLLELRCCG